MRQTFKKTRTADWREALSLAAVPRLTSPSFVRHALVIARAAREAHQKECELEAHHEPTFSHVLEADHRSLFEVADCMFPDLVEWTSLD